MFCFPEAGARPAVGEGIYFAGSGRDLSGTDLHCALVVGLLSFNQGDGGTVMNINAALLWKEWRETRAFLLIALGIFVVLPMIGSLENLAVSAPPLRK